MFNKQVETVNNKPPFSATPSELKVPSSLKWLVAILTTLLILGLAILALLIIKKHQLAANGTTYRKAPPVIPKRMNEAAPEGELLDIAKISKKHGLGCSNPLVSFKQNYISLYCQASRKVYVIKIY